MRRFGKDEDGRLFEWEWAKELGKVTPNANGATGFARLFQCSDGKFKPGQSIRVHLCKNSPCTAMWKPSTYNQYEPPLHLQAVPTEAAVAELLAAEGPTAAVAEPAAEGPTAVVAEPAAAVEPAAVLEPAAVMQPVAVGTPAPLVEPGVKKDQVQAPGSPKRAELQWLQPSAPATCIDLCDEGDVSVVAVSKTAVAGTASIASDERAQLKVKAKLLALSREIGKPRAYVGYSAFLLMGLLKKRQPSIWEGAACIDVLEVFAPWAKETCTTILYTTGIACCLVSAGASVEFVPVSEEHPLTRTGHFVGGCPLSLPESAVADEEQHLRVFEAYYAARGIAIMNTICDGDCGLDCMNMMLGLPSTVASRNALRTEISDYLMARINERWMQEIMVALQELERKDVDDAWSDAGGTPVAQKPVDFDAAPAVPEPAPQSAAAEVVAAPSEEIFAAIRWASKLPSSSDTLSLIRSLPPVVVEEQVQLYRKRDETAVAETANRQPKLEVTTSSLVRAKFRTLVAQRFEIYCKNRCMHSSGGRLPRGFTQTFIAENIIWKAQQKTPQATLIQRWYAQWKKSRSTQLTAVAGNPVVRTTASLLKSRAPVKTELRQRAVGAGRPYRVPLVRQALYEWWSSIRYAIDWKALVHSRRSHGKKHLARFPRSLLRLKVQQLQEFLAYSCLVSGNPVQSIKSDSWWFKRWEDEYGLSMRKANRKYQVPRAVLKERLEIFLVSLFSVRLLIFLQYGYDPLIMNWDQSPFHHNETGSQDKPTLGTRGGIVPVVEGNSDTKTRWTANLMTQSRFTAVADSSGNVRMPPAECMFKAEPGGSVDKRLQEYRRSRGFPSWFTVTVGPKGSYREHDVITFLQRHLEEWTEGRDWRILLADDYSAHKSENVWSLSWSRGYILIIHGGGATPVAQTVDTDLNEHVRRRYGEKEAHILMNQMRMGVSVPKLSGEEAMNLMLEVLSDPELHKHAAEGYKYVGQSIDLHGAEDAVVCREAGHFWREQTTDGYPSMRPKLDATLADVEEEFRSNGLEWGRKGVKRLIQPYPPREKVDRVLANLGEDYYLDAIHHIEDGEVDTAVAETSSSSDGGDGDDQPAGMADGENTCDGELGSTGMEIRPYTCGTNTGMEIEPLSASQIDAVHLSQTSIATLEAALESIKSIGNVSAVQSIEAEIAKERRRERELSKQSPAVADAFARLRSAEDLEYLCQKRALAEQKDRKRAAETAVAEKNAAVAELKRIKQSIADAEGQSACRYAIKTFTVEALGGDSATAGGAKCRKNRFDVLDRLSRHKSGLSAAQRNDWAWFKEAWDQTMVAQHGEHWGSVFSEWMQGVLDDGRSTAFSVFVHSETCRVFHATVAIHVPGG